MFSEIFNGMPSNAGPKAASIISETTTMDERPANVAIVTSPVGPHNTNIASPSNKYAKYAMLGLLGIFAILLIRRYMKRPTYDAKVLPGPPVSMPALTKKLEIIQMPEERHEIVRAHAERGPLGEAVEAVTGRPPIAPPEDIVPVHGVIPVWTVPEEISVEEHVAEPSIDELVRRREAATKELETFMASGLKQMGLKPVNPE